MFYPMKEGGKIYLLNQYVCVSHLKLFFCLTHTLSVENIFQKLSSEEIFYISFVFPNILHQILN